MISHKHKCIFIHIPKAAGTSIEMAFLEDLGLNMDNRHALLIGENTNKTIGPRRISHLLANEYVSQHYISKELFDSYYKFAFVRNPYNRLYSTYKFLNFSDYMNFDTFVNDKLEELKNSNHYGFFLKSQYDYLYEEERLLVDFVGKFENIKKDFAHVVRQLGFENIELKHYNKTSSEKGFFSKLGIVKRVSKDFTSISKLSFSDKEFTFGEAAKEKILRLYENDFVAFDYSI